MSEGTANTTTTTGTAPTNATPAQSGAQGGAAAATSPAPSATTDWTSGLPDLSRGYVQNKGWKGPQDLVESYQNLEKNFGVPAERLVTLPKDETDAEGWNKVWGKLGKPEKPEGYGIKGKDGNVGDFHKWASQTFHEAGLTAKQAQAMAGKWDAYVENLNKSEMDSYTQKVEQEVSSLKSEWGSNHDNLVNQAKQAAKHFGVPEEVINGLEKQMGYTQTMKFFQKIGAKLGEGNFVAGERNTTSIMTPEAAASKLQELKSDPEFVKAFINGGAKEKMEMERLHRYMYPQAQ